MKKIILASTAALLATLSAAAAATKIEFKRDSGEVFTVTLNGDGTGAGPDGSAMNYTFEEEGKKLCMTAEGGEAVCAVFEETFPEPKVGDSTRYQVG